MPKVTRRHVLGVLAAVALLPVRRPLGAETASPWAIVFEALEGGPLPLARYRGKVLLVVNTASFCGFTPQFRELQQLFERYRQQGLVVVGVSSDSFRQEAADRAGVRRICDLYAVDFPMTATVPVRGPDAHPFFRWVEAQAGPAALPQWNFTKYLIGRDGGLLGFWRSATSPLAREVTEAIERALAAPPPA
ncbi:MAG: glutathione peroxidase [Nitrospiraceae bacterium]|jgi:glutathione peroxidase|nr:MAG: glutathione peroxidase [Nitrospiraceae bacterium]